MERGNRPHLGSITKEAPAKAQEDKQGVILVYGYEGVMAVKGGLLALGGYLLGVNKDGSSKGGNGNGNCDYC